MIESFVLALINRMLAQQDWARERLHEHVGQMLALECGPLNWRWLVVEDAHLRRADQAMEASVSLRLPTAAVQAWLGGTSEDLAHHVEISGNARFVETISLLLEYLRPDVGAALSPFLGDVLAHRVEQVLLDFGRQLVVFSRHGGERLQAVLAQPAANWGVGRGDWREWRGEVEALVVHLDTLEKRIDRL